MASVMDLVWNFFILIALSVDRFNWAEAQFRSKFELLMTDSIGRPTGVILTSIENNGTALRSRSHLLDGAIQEPMRPIATRQFTD